MEQKYRMLKMGETIQDGDEVWEFGRGPWRSVSESEYGQLHRNGYWKMRRPVAAKQEDHMDMKRKLENQITDLTRRLEDALSDKVIAEKERDGWRETAAQHLRNEDFYRGIVTDIGNMFGLKARIADDGTICKDVLALRVPELVVELIVENY
jgi:hypothetical protein